MAASPPGKPPRELPSNSELLEGKTAVGGTEQITRLRLALESVRQQAHTLNEQITHEMERLGLPLTTHKYKS